MTTCMIARGRISRPAFLTSVLALGLLASACQSDVTQYCQKETGLTGESLTACIRGFTELAPLIREQDDKCVRTHTYDNANCEKALSIAEAQCQKEKSDCAELLYLDEGQSIPSDNDCRSLIPNTPSKGSDKWFDLANSVANRYNGCHAGVEGYFDIIENYSRPRTPGCMTRVDSRGYFVCAE